MVTFPFGLPVGTGKIMSPMTIIYYSIPNVHIMTWKIAIDSSSILGEKHMRKHVREFLTVEELARELRVNQKTIIRWIQTGYLPGFKVGRTYRVLKTDYQKFLEKRSIQPEPPDTPTSP
jgi:excisionase family DNA binding protein